MQKKRWKSNCKKGNAAIEVLTVIIVLVVFAFSVLAGRMILTELNDDTQLDDSLGDEAKGVMAEQDARYSSLFDGLFVFLFILLWGVVIVSAFMIDSHPIFFIFTVILLIMSFVVAIYIGNVYEEVVDDGGEFQDAADTMPMMDWILSNLLLVAIVVGFSIVGVLFAKNRVG